MPGRAEEVVSACKFLTQQHTAAHKQYRLSLSYVFYWTRQEVFKNGGDVNLMNFEQIQVVVMIKAEEGL